MFNWPAARKDPMHHDVDHIVPAIVGEIYQLGADRTTLNSAMVHIYGLTLNCAVMFSI